MNIQKLISTFLTQRYQHVSGVPLRHLFNSLTLNHNSCGLAGSCLKVIMLKAVLDSMLQFFISTFSRFTPASCRMRYTLQCEDMQDVGNGFISVSPRREMHGSNQGQEASLLSYSSLKLSRWINNREKEKCGLCLWVDCALKCKFCQFYIILIGQDEPTENRWQIKAEATKYER